MERETCDGTFWVRGRENKGILKEKALFRSPLPLQSTQHCGGCTALLHTLFSHPVDGLWWIQMTPDPNESSNQDQKQPSDETHHVLTYVGFFSSSGCGLDSK